MQTYNSWAAKCNRVHFFPLKITEDISDSCSGSELYSVFSHVPQNSEDHPSSSSACTTLQEIKRQHRERVAVSGTQRIEILREDVWRESIAVFKNTRFNKRGAPRVVFERESGIDGGGLSRECGSLLQRKANLFEGIEDRKLPIYSAEGIHSRLFQLVGKMVAYLIFHLDIGVPCFSPAAYHYIAIFHPDLGSNR